MQKLYLTLIRGIIAIIKSHFLLKSGRFGRFEIVMVSKILHFDIFMLNTFLERDIETHISYS